MTCINLISDVINILNYYLWSYILVIFLLIVSLYFSFKIKFSQIVMLGHSFTLVSKKDDNKHNHHVSSFQAFSTSMASVVGVGSIAGIGIAISLGGPGAIFWLWVISFIGMSTSLIEHTLGQVYKEKYGDKNIFVGGPSYYIMKGVKNKYAAYLFSTIIVITYGIVFNSVQSNTIGFSLYNAFNIPQYVSGIIITFLSAITILGGIKRIAKISSFIVPAMGFSYLVIVTIVILINIHKIPYIFLVIIKSAFGYQEFASGSVSYVFMQALLTGIKRAMFSTEAGLGSTPNITASAFVKHPARQGFIGMLGVFFVAFVVCTGTSVIILSSNIYSLDPTAQGIILTQESLKDSLGKWSVYILSIAIFIFGFTSIVGNYSYAEHNLSFIHAKNWLIYLLRLLLVITIFLGSIASLHIVWNLADLFMAIMIFINIWALLKLTNVATEVIFDYKNQLKYSSEPIFKKEKVLSLKNYKENIW